ncbi:hypothetical protein GCM10009616_24020 [Microlunatus lacustris]
MVGDWPVVAVGLVLTVGTGISSRPSSRWSPAVSPLLEGPLTEPGRPEVVPVIGAANAWSAHP